MLSTEQCIEILNHDTLALCEGVNVNSENNTLEIVNRDITIALNESQKRLLICLIKKVCTKRDIINVVWYENHQRISDNNYHQLTFQLRALFQRNNLPSNLLMTVPYYGLKLNEKQWENVAQESAADKPAAGDKKSEVKKNTVVEQTPELSFTSGKVVHSPYLSHISIAQNAFILCMFVTLLIFI